MASTDIYATYQDYVAVTDDTQANPDRVNMMLEGQSAKLRATCGIPSGTELTGDAKILARDLVVDAIRKAIAPPLAALGDVPGATQASWSANGFTASATYSNPTGDAYFNRNLLKAFKNALGRGSVVGSIAPDYGPLA